MQGDVVPSTHPKEKRVFSPRGRQEREQSHHQPELDPRSFIIIEVSQKSVGVPEQNRAFPVCFPEHKLEDYRPQREPLYSTRFLSSKEAITERKVS